MEMSDRLLLRSCTTDNDSQKNFLECIKNNDLAEIKSLLEEERIDLNHIYDYPYYKTPISIACQFFSDTIKPECIELLLNLGADPLLEDDDNKNTLFYAAESCNKQILIPILKYLKRFNYDFENSSVLLLLIEQIKYEIEYGETQKKENDFLDVIELLIEYGIDINKSNLENGQTAIYIAANNGYKSIITLLLNHGPINLDKYKNKKNQTARDIIQENNLYEGKLPDICDENKYTDIETIYKNLREKNLSEFKSNFEEIDPKKITQEHKNDLLHMSVDKGLEGFVLFLLEKGADTNSIKQDSLLEKAVYRGYFKIVKILMRKNPTPILVANSLMSLLKVQDMSKKSENTDYNKCLDCILRYKDIKINYKDPFTGKTALHLAALYQSQEVVLKILKSGASLASVDIFDKLPLVDMDSETLKNHLDDCIEQTKKCSNDDKNKNITIRVTSLLPARQNTDKVDNEENCKLDVENLSETQKIYKETAVLQYISQCKELKHLLKHPVIMTFIFLKWFQIRSFFYLNLSVYLTFFISLLTYIMFGYNQITETNCPVVINLSFITLAVSFVVLVFREVGQMIIYRLRYLSMFENWLEIVLLLVTALILIQQSKDSTIRQLSAVAIVLSAIELLLLIGHIPCLSTNIMMLRTVSFTFFKLLCWYSILLLAFAFSFYTLFRENDSLGDETNKNETNSEDEEQDFFEHPGMSLLKTIVMLTGEFDTGSIKFNSYPIISHLIFILFVFLITIVLFNLLNGLAVSDTQIIKNDAKLYNQILRVEHIARIENVLLNNKLILRWLPCVKKICLFPQNVENTDIKIYENQNYKIIYGDMDVGEEIKCYHCKGMSLGKKIQRDIRNHLHEKINEDLTKKRDDDILKQLNSLKEQINVLQKLLIDKQ